MVKTLLLLILLLGTVAGIAGCATPKNDDPDPVAQQLVSASEEVRVALSTLAAIEKDIRLDGREPMPLVPAVIPPGLEQRVTVDWHAPVETIVRKLARRAGYKVRRIGRPPTIPVIVQLRGQNVPIIELLADASYQAKGVDIVFESDSRLIELRYVNAL